MCHLKLDSPPVIVPLLATPPWNSPLLISSFPTIPLKTVLEGLAWFIPFVYPLILLVPPWVAVKEYP